MKPILKIAVYCGIMRYRCFSMASNDLVVSKLMEMERIIKWQCHSQIMNSASQQLSKQLYINQLDDQSNE